MDRIHSLNKFRAKYKYLNISQVTAILYLIACISEIKRNYNTSCFEYTKIYRKPLYAVHHKYSYFCSSLNISCEKKITYSVSHTIEPTPCHGSSIWHIRKCKLYKACFTPCLSVVSFFSWIDFHKSFA